MKLILNLDVPPDVMEAAEKVAAWAKTQGFKDWAIGPVADRDYLERILRAVRGEKISLT
jgi:hypothetical protein